jgi:hypothetical protein
MPSTWSRSVSLRRGGGDLLSGGAGRRRDHCGRDLILTAVFTEGSRALGTADRGGRRWALQTTGASVGDCSRGGRRWGPRRPELGTAATAAGVEECSRGGRRWGPRRPELGTAAAAAGVEECRPRWR